MSSRDDFETGVLILAVDSDLHLASSKELIETSYGVTGVSIYDRPVSHHSFGGPDGGRDGYMMSVAFCAPNESKLERAVSQVREMYFVKGSIFFKNSRESKYWDRQNWTSKGGD